MKSLSPSDYEKRAIDTIAKHWFHEHVAKIEDRGGGVVTIEWAKPGDWCYAVRYVLWSGTLYVSGDLGEAVYRWSDRISLQFLAGCSLDYFTGKCQASETGRKYVEWDDEVAAYKLNGMLKDAAESEGVPAQKTELFEFIEGACDKESIEAAAREFNDSTGDFETAGQIHLAGEVPNMRAIAHWLGLRMIQEEIDRANSNLPTVEEIQAIYKDTTETQAKNLGVVS